VIRYRRRFRVEELQYSQVHQLRPLHERAVTGAGHHHQLRPGDGVSDVLSDLHRKKYLRHIAATRLMNAT